MKKVMLIHHSGLLGGAGVSLLNTVRTLSESNTVTVYLPSDPDDMRQLLSEQCPEADLHLYGRRIGAVTYYSGGDSVKAPRFWYRLALIFRQWRYWNRAIEEENPDVVAVNSTILCWMSKLQAVRRRKSVCFVRETMRGRPAGWMNRQIRRFLDRFSLVVFLSEYDKNKASLKKARAAVVHNYIDPGQLRRDLTRASAEKELGLSPGKFRVLYVGGVSEMKGFDVAVKAVLSCSENMELLVAGIGFDEAEQVSSSSAQTYASSMRQFLEQNDSSHRIRMLGKQKDMSACYAACDVLVFPMRSPHQARPAFEAGYFGKPVIISDFDNIREFVRNGDNGLTVTPDRPDELAAKLDDLALHPEICAAMGKRNMDNTSLLHDREKNCREISHLLERL